MINSMQNKLKKKIKKKLIGFFVTKVLPILLVVILGGAVVALIIELPSMIGDSVSSYFSELFESESYENIPLRELRDFFAADPDLGGLEELQSPIMLGKYIDLQLNGTLQNVDTEIETLKYKDGILVSQVKSPYQFSYLNSADIYSLPWQIMAATDIVNDNFGVKDYTDDILLLHESLQPRFEGKTSEDFQPEIYSTHITKSKITETRTRYYDSEINIINPETNKIETLIFRRSNDSVSSWTETSEVRIPSELFNQVHYFAGMYDYNISYEEGDTLKSTSTITLTDTDELTVVQVISTEQTSITPYYDGFEMTSPNTYIRDALSYVVPFNRRDMFLELIKNYPFTQSIQIAVTNALGNSGIYFNDGYAEINHNFQYPSLMRRNQPDKYFRQDIVNLSKSLMGLDYFWGGKYNKVGFKENWGQLRNCTSIGSSMTGLDIRDGLDCSGFVQWVYLNAGLSIEGGTYSMLSGGKLDEVTLDKLEPGDLGFYHNYSNGEKGNHVGIYLGYIDGKHLFINAKGAPGGADEIHTTGQVTITALYQEHNGFAPVSFKKFYKYNVEKLE